MSDKAKPLSDEDRILWNVVARSTRPLRRHRKAEKAAPKSIAETPPAVMAKALAPVAAPPTRQHIVQGLDKSTLTRLSRGKLPIDGRVDLHGMTQDQAYALLLSFLRDARDRGIRYVLVITGKGLSSGGNGILRRQVPAWLSTPPFRALVSSHDVSARHHGGDGAIYVRLRRNA